MSELPLAFAPASQEARQRYRSHLTANYPAMNPAMAEAPLWMPYQHSKREFESLVQSQYDLQLGLRAIMDAALHDDRLRRLLTPRLDDDTVGQLALLEGVTLPTQFLRPDYIMDSRGHPQICEINTRFIFNGNHIAVLLSQILSEYYEFETAYYDRLESYMHASYGGAGSTLFLRGREPQHDLAIQKTLTPEGAEIAPQDLRFAQARKYGRIILELHQNELRSVMHEVVRLVLDGVAVHNDPRVVHILHDKRLLVALSDSEFMSEYVGAEVAERLAAAVVPSYHPSWPGREPETMPGKRALIKGAISGKGDNIGVVRVSTYRNVLEEPEYYVYQQWLTPRPIKNTSPDISIAGTLPMTLEGPVFGPGIIRVEDRRRLGGFRGFSIAVMENT